MTTADTVLLSLPDGTRGRVEFGIRVTRPAGAPPAVVFATPVPELTPTPTATPEDLTPEASPGEAPISANIRILT